MQSKYIDNSIVITWFDKLTSISPLHERRTVKIVLQDHFFGRHSGIEPTNDYHEHTHTRTPPRLYRASTGSPLIRRCPGPIYAGPRAQPQSLTGLGAAQSMTGPTQGLSTPHALNRLPLGSNPGRLRSHPQLPQDVTVLRKTN